MENETKARNAKYFNQAHHNALMIIKEVLRKMNPEITGISEENLGDKLYEKTQSFKPIEKQRLVELLNFYFPFVEVLAKDEDRENPVNAQIDKLRWMLILLEDLRNFYSHYSPHNSILQIGYLEKSFDNVDFSGEKLLIEVRKITNMLWKKSITDLIEIEYFKHSDENKSTSKSQYKYKSKLAEIEASFAPLLGISKMSKNVPPQFALVYTENKDAIDENGKLQFDKKGKKITFTNVKSINESGIMFFLSLFLTKGEISNLMNQTTGFKRNDDLIWESKRWAYRYFCCKYPASRLRSVSMTKESLMLDILGELQKCPEEIYPLISDADRRTFKYGLDVYKNENDVTIENETIHKRYLNRFSYLALRFLDSLNLPSLRFQICLGNFNMSQYEKRLQDDIIERRLQKKIKVFDKVANYPYENDVDDGGDITKSSISKLISETKTHLSTNNTCILLKEDGVSSWQHFAPHYNIQNNNIGISFNAVNFKELCENTSLNKRDLPHLKEPDAFLSIYELPQLIWFCLKKKNNLQSVETYIKRRIEVYKNEFNTGIEKNGAENPIKYKSDYPKPIFALLTNSYIKPIERVKNICFNLIEENSRLLTEVIKWKDINKQKANKPNVKKLTYNPLIPKGKRGAVATWLTKDIIKFCIPKVKSQIGSYFANSMQESLALFDKEKFITLIKYKGEKDEKQWEINILEAHPFLKNVIKLNNLFDIYESYLKSREISLKNELSSAEVKGINKTYLSHYLGISVNMISLKSYLKPFKTNNGEHLVVNLPRGLFNEAIINDFAKKQENESKGFSFNHNLSFLYPNSQLFYNLERTYKLFDVNRMEKESHLFSDIKITKGAVSKELFKVINNNEKQLRQRKIEDTTLFLALSELSLSTLGKNIFENYKLSDLSNSNILLKRQNFVFPIEKTAKKIRANITLKDAGNFTKLLVDKRIIDLLPYFKENEVDYHYQFEDDKNENYYGDGYRPNIKDEIEIYEKQREEIFKHILLFEKFISEWVKGKEIENKFFTFYKEKKYFNHLKDYLKPINKILNDKLNVEILKSYEQNGKYDQLLLPLQIMKNIRNAVCHNQFFKFDDFEIIKHYFSVNELEKEAFLKAGAIAINNSFEIGIAKPIYDTYGTDLLKSKEERRLTSLKFFNEFTNGNNHVFISQWWFTVYIFMAEKIKTHLLN
jgi:hypothetical protein